MTRQSESMTWIVHNGLGCPVPWETVVETVDPTGEKHVSRADGEINVCEAGNSWIWWDEEPSDFEIVAYRIVETPTVENQLEHSVEGD